MIELRHVSKSFAGADGTVDALRDVNLTIRDGDIYGVIGMSGAGKSTLVRCINLLERPTDGQVLYNGHDLAAMDAATLRATRRKVAMIFQHFDLLMQRSCLQNVCFPLELAGVPRQQARVRAEALLQLVGLSDKAKSYPAQLSGGQQQRVAIARALATDPEVLLCDEATSALDPKTTHAILELLRSLHDTLGLTIVMITHQMAIVEEICSRVAILDAGQVVEEGDVSDVFSTPKSRAAKRLVYPDALEDDDVIKAAPCCIRVVFRGADATAAPLIATMAMEERIAASILYASTKSLNGRVYGSMLLGLSDASEAQRAIAYLGRTSELYAEEVRRDV